ncbi:MAG TPA: hypothetical protein DCX53_15175 [Anaerolineae bacterium]|nr:hypothetical protein [Anaerolineae bacterium]
MPPVTTLDETTILAGKYDDTDARLDYTGDWVSELFVSGAFKETLYISPEIGDSMTFTFFGKQLILGYKSDTGFGTLTIKIDNSEYSLNQLTGSEWVSVQLSQGVHSVTVLHKDGDFVSIDYINIIE